MNPHNAPHVTAGDEVTLYPLTGGTEGKPPESPLWGAGGSVVSVTDWGAYVSYRGVLRSGIIRVGWDEFKPVGLNGVAQTKGPSSPTGDCCITCGSVNMTRDGTCLLCLDCGDKTGGCG